MLKLSRMDGKNFMGKVLVIGSAVVDISVKLKSLPVSGQDVEAQDETVSTGGCALNVARVLKAYGIPCTLFVPVGEGRYGDMAAKTLRSEGFPIALKVRGKDSGHCFALIEAEGERTFITVPGVEKEFKREWFEEIEPGEYTQVFVGGYSLEGGSGEVIARFLEENPHLKVFFGPGPRITALDPELLERIYRLSPVVHVNEKESLDYTGAADVADAARILWERTRETVIITRGSRGAYFCGDGVSGYVPGEKVKVVSTSGAGDAHLGGFITALILGKNVEEAVKFANRVSAAVVSKAATGFEQGDIGNGKNKKLF